MAETLNGLRRPESGSLVLDGVELAGTACGRRDSLGNGLHSRRPEHRRHRPRRFPSQENLVLKDVGRRGWSRAGFLRLGPIARNAAELRERFDIRCPSVDTAAGSLSGGNIQKVILARELARSPKALVAVYPHPGTRHGRRGVHPQAAPGAPVRRSRHPPHFRGAGRDHEPVGPRSP
ncbi:MAG: hypothetical protein M0C28_30410 [Candidatus Moduliflexus flocculans]|nr:hypothetical protein [Candidatus Moduliflexus flocculans]